MARAERVGGIRPRRPLTDNAVRVIEVRLDEFLSWRDALLDPDRVTELHDMRIAAKRLRYALEMFEICFAGIKPILHDLTDIQEDLGTIHDLDVLIDTLRGRLRDLEAPLEEEVTELMAGEGTSADKSRKLRTLLSARGRDRRRLGLYGLIGDKIAERRRRYTVFQSRWVDELDGLAERLRDCITVTPEHDTVSDAAAGATAGAVATGQV